MGQSEQSELITNDFVRVNSTATFTNGYLRLKSDTRYNMKSVETKESDNDTEIYYELITGNQFLYASRVNFLENYTDNYASNWGFGNRYGPMSLQAGHVVRNSDVDAQSTVLSNKGLRFIVSLPASSINLEQGNGEEENGWGIQ